MRLNRLPKTQTGTVLNPLGLSSATVPEHSGAGVVVGAITNKTATSTLSITDTAGTRFALSGNNIVTGATQTDYATATSHNITVRETLAGALNTPCDTVITIAVTNVSGGLAQPTLTNFSALGVAPMVLMGSTTDYVAGYRGQLQLATDSGFSGITQNQIFFIDGSSWANNSTSTGIVTPSGTYYARWRVVRDNEFGLTTVTGNDPLANALSFTADVSLWSTTFTDTITAASTVLNTVTGVDKRTYVGVSGSPALVATGTATVGSPCNVRATAAATGTKQWEVTLTTQVQFIIITVEDRTTALGPDLSPLIGFNNSAGVSLRISSSAWAIWKGGSAVQSGSLSPVNGDVISVVQNSVGGTVAFYRTHLGTTVQIGTTVTGLTLAAYGACVGTYDADVATCNFGQTAFASTLGVAAYG